MMTIDLLANDQSYSRWLFIVLGICFDHLQSMLYLPMPFVNLGCGWSLVYSYRGRTNIFCVILTAFFTFLVLFQ